MLNNDEQLFCEGKLRKNECLEALKSMASDKSPGNDGLPCEFYEVFWNDVAEILIKSFNYSYEMGKLRYHKAGALFSFYQKRMLILKWLPIVF